MPHDTHDADPPDLLTTLSETDHPRVLSRIRVHRRATVFDSIGTQFVMPRLIAVDLTQPVRGTVLRQPCGGIVRADVDRLTRHMSRGLRVGHPSRGLFLRAILDDGVP